jgi:hypothetical protein
MSLEYSSFELLDEQRKEKENEYKRIQMIRQNKIKKIVDYNNLILLKNEYFDMNSYYYSEKYKKMYVVSNIGEKDEDPIFQISNDCRIMILNNICNKNCGNICNNVYPKYK